MTQQHKDESPFERRAYAYLERGYSVVPIAPGTKRPGQYSEADGWRGLFDWERFNTRLPTEHELPIWYTWPGAGIGLLTGKLSGVIGLDRDWDAPGTDALERMIPYTPVKKKGAKGYTAFFRYNGEKSCSFNIGGARVLDVLSDGRQTLMPGTIHPDGHAYIYLTEDLLEDYDPCDLPQLPDDFLEQVARTLAPYQTQEDTKYQRKALPDNNDAINTDLSIQAEYFRDLNRTALNRLEDWVPKIVPHSRAERDGYRTIATWRGAKNHNVGIHPSGIFDFGGNYGMSPIDIIMHANSLTFGKAAEALRACLALNEPAPITMTVGGSKPTTPTQPVVLPWLKPAPAPTAPVMLPPQTSIDPAPAIQSFISNPPGILGDIARWMTATAPKSQPELSVAAAIALVSVVMGRTYRSQYGNFTSLYIVMIAKSTEGKEHPQSCCEKILTAADLGKLIGGSGYTSAGAVFSALLDSPAHLATIDELGKLLKMSRANGQAHSEAAIDKLIEAFGRLDGVMRPPTYSKMTMNKTQAAGLERIVHNPAISLLGATTPGTFYAALTTDLVQDGFLGRCIVVESDQPRQLTRFVDRTPPPAKIIEWCQAVHVSGAVQGDLAGVNPAEMPPTVIELPFDESCMPLLHHLESELNDVKEANEGEHLDVLLGRTIEKSMRLAMIVAKATDIYAKRVMPAHLEWAIQYVRHYDLDLIAAVKRERTENDHDANMKKMMDLIKGAKRYSKDAKYGQAAKAGGLARNKLLALMKGLNSKQVTELVNTAYESDMISKQDGVLTNLGCSCEVYFPTGHE